MTATMQQLTAERDRLSAARRSIANQYQAAANGLAEMQRNLPGLIAAVALGETDKSRLEATRAEISRLRELTKEPYPQAISLIEKQMTPISEQMSKAISGQAAIDQERAFRVHFNYCLTNRSRKNTDLEVLHNTAQHWHRKDVDSLDSLHYEFERAGFHYQPGSPTFVEFAASKGLPLYNLDVTSENITQPKGATP